MAAARMVPVPPEFDIPQITEDRVALERSTREFADNFDELLDEYPDQWIALSLHPSEGRIVVSGESLEELDKAIEARQLSRSRIFIYYMDTHPRVWIL